MNQTHFNYSQQYKQGSHEL